MPREQTSPWVEREYVEYLDHERHLFAWCLSIYGGLSQPVALARAEDFYRYEPAAIGPLRGLVFHDEAWHWAMIELFGQQYWQARPELESPPADYRAESQRYERSKK
jgi:hypothetical protein